MSELFVIKIHNNAPGRMVRVDNFTEAKCVLLEMAADQLNRNLTTNELEEIMNDGSLYVEQDADNWYTWAIVSPDSYV